MKLLRENLLVQFSVVCFAIMAVMAMFLAITLSNKIRADAINDLVDEAVGSSESRLLRTITPADLEGPMLGERYDQFNEFVLTSIVSDRTALVKLWAKDGTIVYSTERDEVGVRFPGNENLLRVLRGQKTVEVEAPGKGGYERLPLQYRDVPLIEVYTPIIFPGTTEPQGAFEIYQFYEPKIQRIKSLRNWVFSSIGVGFVVLYAGLVSIVGRGWSTINNQRNQLEVEVSERKQAEKKIRASLHEKEVLLREIHHRVKNNLQVISSLLDLGAIKIKDDRAIEPLKDSQNRVHSMALIHEKLYESEELTTIDFGEYCRDLASTLFSSYDVSPDTISLETSIDDVVLSVNSAIPCGLIINELVSNSLKHAFPAGDQRKIRVDLHRDGDGKFALTVEDDGIGLPEDFDFRTATSLGLQLVNTLTSQLDGTIELVSSEGTAFKLTFADPEYEGVR